jgi:hypothetical protein
VNVNRIVVAFLLSFLSSFIAHAEKTHYEFTLPDHYVGWVQITFQDPHAPKLTQVGRSVILAISEGGTCRTRTMRVLDDKPADSFFYRIAMPNGSFRLEPVPSNYLVKGIDDGGFEVAGGGGKDEGRRWFIFIGPPEIRAKVPFADWKKELQERIRRYGTDETGPPDPLPTPGRMTAVATLNFENGSEHPISIALHRRKTGKGRNPLVGAAFVI